VTDSEIIKAAQVGDDGAWNAIYDHLHGPLLGYFRMYGASDPENLLGEVFLRLARGINRFQGDLGGLKAYAMTTAANLLRDQVRRQAVRPKTAFLEPSTFEIAANNGQLSTESAEEAVLASEAFLEFGQLLGSLTQDQREVLYLRFVADLSVAETARAMGRTSGAVKQLQHRAIATVRDTMPASAETLDRGTPG
jgi:RNA polymerase sigma-70 factor (ECF subfamily)